MDSNRPNSGMLYFLAIFMWVIAWWLADLAGNDIRGKLLVFMCAFTGTCYAAGGIATAIPRPSPFVGFGGQLLWALRPRLWLVAWVGIVLTVQVFGAPMLLWNYGGGRCLYIDWHLNGHWRAAKGDGRFGGCRALSTR